MIDSSVESGVDSESAAVQSPPVTIFNQDASGPIVLICEHASAHIPGKYSSLGLTEQAAQSHAAWDPGALALAQQLSESLNAPLIASGVSRLVYDCNRPPGEASAMPARTENIDIPGNAQLSSEAVQERIAGVYRPFESAVETLLDARKAMLLPSVLVTIHSFSPIWFGKPREVELGLLHDSDSRLADVMLNLADECSSFKTCRNQPYGPEDGVTWTLKRHALPRGLLNVMIEVRNDRLLDVSGFKSVTATLLELLNRSMDHLLHQQSVSGEL